MDDRLGRIRKNCSRMRHEIRRGLPDQHDQAKQEGETDGEASIAELPIVFLGQGLLLHAFARGDYGPSGENVTDRLVIAGLVRLPKGFEFSLLSQAESSRPFTMTTPVDVNGFGDTLDDRAVVNGVQTGMDQFRGTPYIQTDIRVSRPFTFRDRWRAMPFIEIFNLFNRNNPGANYVTNLAALPTPVNSFTNATAFCLNADCSQTQPITSLNQLRVPAGALGDFFGPGTTVGIPFAAQLGVRLSF